MLGFPQANDSVEGTHARSDPSLVVFFSSNPPGKPMIRSLSAGFTLIELLVVITILAILAGAALPFVQSYVEESRISKCKTDLEEVGKALAVYETREKDYSTTDVGQLTGRYLNKAPIDPWGKALVIATESGFVVSCGPDRLQGTPDDLTYNYQPPLALVRAKWIDVNQTGAVDTDNVPDQVSLHFSRKLGPNTGWVLPSNFQMSSTSNVGNVFDFASIASISNGRVLVLNLKPGMNQAFVAGSDSFMVTDGNSLFDHATPVANRCICSQTVVILAQ